MGAEGTGCVGEVARGSVGGDELDEEQQVRV